MQIDVHKLRLNTSFNRYKLERNYHRAIVMNIVADLITDANRS